ncbi:hypothetical protein WJX84_005197 [Apatococcus fuscideae]|uniref:LOV domain-containing protein n=1 Tax=Apatococcus fuscideae TaxID=2026836 RepID=A0AAW1SCR9_9CHLO
MANPYSTSEDEKLAANADNFLSCITVLDGAEQKHQIAYMDKAYEQLSGYGRDELLGRPFLEMCADATTVTLESALTESQQVPSQLDLSMRKKDGSRSSTGPVEPPKSDSAGKTESPGKPESPATIKSGPSRTHSVMPPAAQHLCLLLDITARKPRRIGKYIMGKQLGRGAFGTVRLGKDPATGDLVAIKEIDAGNFRNISQIEQIQEEINVLSNLKHPNIIHLLESIFIGKMVYVIMEYVAGGSLMDFVNSQPDGKLSETEARRILQQLLEALDYCHRRRIIHRDLKPENVLLDLQSNIRVADFGLAAITTPMSGNLQMACGTPEFTAPEILKGREYVGTAVDIWSLGVMLYEMIRGELPFRASGSTDLVKLVSSGRYKPMEGVGRDCRDLVSKMLTVQPADRITLDSIRRHPWSEGFSPDDDEGAEDALPSAHDSAADPTAEPVDDSMQRSLHLVLPDSLASASDDEGSKAPGVIRLLARAQAAARAGVAKWLADRKNSLMRVQQPNH